MTALEQYLLNRDAIVCDPVNETRDLAALAEQQARIADLNAINSSMADDLCSMTGVYERAKLAEAELNERAALNGLLTAERDALRDRLA